MSFPRTYWHVDPQSLLANLPSHNRSPLLGRGRPTVPTSPGVDSRSVIFFFFLADSPSSFA